MQNSINAKRSRFEINLTRPFQSHILAAALKCIEKGSIEIWFPDETKLSIKGAEPGPFGQIEVLTPRVYPRLFFEGSVGFGEMYMDGWWKTPDLQNLLDVLLLNNDNMTQRFSGGRLNRLKERLCHFMNRNSRLGSKRNIAHHYDLGNEFYSLWLDPTMTYSSAIFQDSTSDLSSAQQNKYSAICDQLAVSSGEEILEIGCGWGGFAEYAIRERGLKVTGITISRAQKDYAQKRLFEAGLAERSNICLRDYRDEQGVYDGIASIEMIEAVGEKYWPHYFSTLRNRLRCGRNAVLQAITVPDSIFPKYRKNIDFMQKHIFPGGMLLSLSVLRRQAQVANLQIIDEKCFSASYSHTLRLWREQFNKRWDQIAKLGFDERFYRMWNYYLAASAAGFAANSTNVVHFICRRKL